jgi:hypothetical protein
MRTRSVLFALEMNMLTVSLVSISTRRESEMKMNLPMVQTPFSRPIAAWRADGH